MSSETLSMSEPSSPATGSDSSALRLWNPNAAACWSLLFSPAFGAYLHMLNWQILGQAEKAAEARTWFRMLCGLLALNLIIGVYAIAHDKENPVPNSIGLALTVAWYIWSARSQVKYLTEAQGGIYVRKGWAKPVLIAIAATLAYFLLALGLSGFFKS